MITYLVTAAHSYTMKSFLDSPLGEPLRDLVTVAPYEEVALKVINSGTVIFSDIERLDDMQRQSMSMLCESLSSLPEAPLTLNHPALSMRRFDLLRTMYCSGINDFNVWRLKDLLCGREHIDTPGFQVFIRNENDHMGPRSRIIRSSSSLWLQSFRQFRKTGRLGDKIVTGFLDTSDKQGIFRKYSAFRVGEAVIPRHVFFSRNWAIKEADLTGPHMTDEEMKYVKSNPHRDELMKIFEIAKIGYGRIDYGLKNGRIQVWEINTNPMLLSPNSAGRSERSRIHELFAERFAAVLKSL